MINAIVMIHAESARIPETAQAVADLSGVTEVYSCAGDVDLIAIVKVRDHAQIADVVTGGINKVPGVSEPPHTLRSSHSPAQTSRPVSRWVNSPSIRLGRPARR